MKQIKQNMNGLIDEKYEKEFQKSMTRKIKVRADREIDVGV